MNKGQIMKAVYTEDELRNIDAGLPKPYWDGIEPNLQVDTYWHVMNYNKPYTLGKLENMKLIAKERNIKLD